jgi:hypothetical protein
MLVKLGTRLHVSHNNQSTNSVVWGLVKTLYGDDQNACSMAYNSLRRASETAAGGPVADGTASNSNMSTATLTTTESTTRLAHNISIRFQKPENKFDGSLGQDYSEFISNYIDTANDYNRDDGQRLKYLHHLFSGEAKQYHRQYVEGISTTFSDANAICLKQFNSPTRQNRVKKY